MSNKNGLERDFGLEPDSEDVLERRSRPQERRRASFSLQDYMRHQPTEQEEAEFTARLAAKLAVMTEEERSAWEKQQIDVDQL